MTPDPPLNADTVRVFIDVTGWFDLALNEVWPDGDPPEVITPEAVRGVMERCGGKASTLSDWELLDSLEVHVSVGTGEAVEVWAKGWRQRQIDGTMSEGTPQ